VSIEPKTAGNPGEYCVLVVDDRIENRYTTVHTLTRAGFAVTEAATGKEALALSKLLPTVIVLDVKLPDILGYEVCRRIKSNPHTSHIPILQLSAAFHNTESKLYALGSGADAYLTQPAEPVVLVATVKSLVRLHQAESQARLSARQWQTTFDSLSEGVAITDASGTIVRCNRSMISLLGRSYNDIENRSGIELIRGVFGVTLTAESLAIPREMQLGTRFFRLRVDPIVIQEVPNGTIFILEETTDRKRAEQALVISEGLAATGRTAHTIAHEINNPLEAITNLLYLLRGALKEPLTAEEYLATAEQELERVSRISKQILSFNREAATPIEVCPPDLLEDVLALHNRMIVDKEIIIQREWDTRGSVRVFPAQMRQVFSNLVRNAIEASSSGGEIRIRVSEHKRWNKTGKSNIWISIADHGVGIPKENIKKIFEAFFTTKALKGSGVGLWLSATIVNEHKGRLRVRSSARLQKSGTCMTVVLPASASVARHSGGA